MRRGILTALALVALLGAFGAFYRTPALSDGDPDRYYHFALSKLTWDSGRAFLRSVPQIEDLGWGDWFVDKEFLFHELTTLGYGVAGERGVRGAAFLCSLLALAAFFLFASRRVPLPTAAAATVLTFSSPFLAFRLALLRPHTLAVLAFVLMNLAILSRRPRLTAAAVMLFTLSYHAFYVALLCMLIIAALSFLEERARAREWRVLALHGAFGCLAGVLANPYFPGTIALAVIHAKIPDLIQGELRGVSFGEELVPVRADHYWNVFHGPLVVVLAAAFLLGMELSKARRDRNPPLEILYLLGVAMFFTVITFTITRAGEYQIPACGLILVLLAERWKERAREAGLLLGVLAVAQVGYLGWVYKEHVPKDGGVRAQETLRAIAAIPAEPKGAKVFNCEWDRTPYLLYARPDLRFVDILDPSLLYFTNPGAFRTREDLRLGKMADAHGLIRNAFKADYVLCGDPAESAQLRSDPGFQQLYPVVQNPAQSPIVLTLFRVLPEPLPQAVRVLEVSPPATAAANRFAPPTLAEIAALKTRELELERSPYLNLAAALLPGEHQAKDGDPIRCASVAPSAGERKRLAGAELLGLGGGQGFKVWRSGKPLFETRAGFPGAKLIQVLVPLGGPLRESDQLTVLACSAASSPFWGASLTLWKKAELREACVRKNAGLQSGAPPEPFGFLGLQAQTCLGPLAAPAPEAELVPKVP